MVSSVLDGTDATALQMANDRDPFAAVTAEGKEKSVQFLVLGLDLADHVFFSVLCFAQIHRKLLSLKSLCFYQLAVANQ